ncbi:PKD domain-containing protein [Micromonospora krabiensis]|uniref:PKD domain-containing protein n=1 Tax=Micromonospora krabiensis TaxID=307121 RepID=A0A1C3N873_9ACTN|nr:PKD domain-containing protein [Micromonospora krabiensis]SBV28726.1 PKD domain-containing protein [Micromonospora krabiensis]
MRITFLAGLTALTVAGGTLLAGAAPAQAADENTLYVRQNAATGCSDQNPGTLAQPFCSISAAAAVVTGGQTVDIGGGAYRERVVVRASGTPEQPTVFLGSGSSAALVGPTGGFDMDGQHDIVLQNLRVVASGDMPAVDARNSSGITIRGGGYAVSSSAATPVIRFAGVTESMLTQTTVTAGQATNSGVVLDAASSDVDIWDTSVSGNVNRATAEPSTGVRIDGPRNRFLSGSVGGFTGTAVLVGPGATGTVVANNTVTGGAGHGIHNSGATGTAITNNTVRDRCRDGIRVDGASSGVSVQNNVLYLNGYFGQTNCDLSLLDGVEIGVYGEAVGKTVVDYNNAHHYDSNSPTIYAWNTRMSLPAFRAASGQAAHDRETGNTNDNVDSANSAAPGYQELDKDGRPRIDDPAVANTGAGPVAYSDRGATETYRPPTSAFEAILDLATRTVTVDASASKPGLTPIDSYQFSFGDGSTITQSSPVATHTYATTGERVIGVKVTATDGRTGNSTKQVSVLPVAAKVGLLALSNRRYVQAEQDRSLLPNQAGVTTAGQLQLADAGNGKVALFSPRHGKFFTAVSYGSGVLLADSLVVGHEQTFTQIRNGDGSISLQSGWGTYVTADISGTLPLMASAPTIGTWEKFHQVPVADAGRSLQARVNSKYVTADITGTVPLIASRPTASTWERFDIVDLGDGQVALLARSNNRFVTADGAGAKPLLASRPTVSLWERFVRVNNSDGTVSFRAVVNNRYVSADGAGSKPLIANGPSINLWEKYTLG